MIRPASYCGVTGFKPTHDLLPMDGVLTLSKSLDTLGLFTHTPADMVALWKTLGYSSSEEQLRFGVAEAIPACEPEMARTFKHAVAVLRSSGVDVQPIDIAGMLTKLDQANDIEMFYEGARVHEA
jgi:Asp-tRNA(Asn)/Glu-tRNA(Gln) amidotransferase A subunit family amidase